MLDPRLSICLKHLTHLVVPLGTTPQIIVWQILGPDLGCALYNFAGIEAINGIVVGTGNKVEDFGVGFYTKYGDGGVDISPIADLYKSEVYALADALGIIQEIQDAAPTDGLWLDGRTDEEQIGATYEELEWAMRRLRTLQKRSPLKGRDR